MKVRVNSPDPLFHISGTEWHFFRIRPSAVLIFAQKSICPDQSEGDFGPGPSPHFLPLCEFSTKAKQGLSEGGSGNLTADRFYDGFYGHQIDSQDVYSRKEPESVIGFCFRNCLINISLSYSHAQKPLQKVTLSARDFLVL